MWLIPVLCWIAFHPHYLLMSFCGCDFDELLDDVLLMMMSIDAFVDSVRMDVMRKTAADLFLKVFVEWSVQHEEDWKMRLRESPVDVVDDESCVEDADGGENAEEAVDRSRYGWKIVVTIDILHDEQVHVVLADYQILFSLLLLHFHNHLPRQFLGPPKLQELKQREEQKFGVLPFPLYE